MGSNTSLFHISSDSIHPELLDCITKGGNLLIIPHSSSHLCNINTKNRLSISDSKEGKLHYRKVKHITFSTSLEGPIKLYGAKKLNPYMSSNQEAIDKLKLMYPIEVNRYVVMVLDTYR